MKKLIFLNLLFVFSLISAQIKFEKGYFITNDGEKHEVLIKNEDWLTNPTEFKYKTSETDTEKIETIKNVKEFQVYGYNKLVRYKGKIENSSQDINRLSYSKEPVWIEKEVYLYEISSGIKTLYYYEDKDKEGKNFFYSDEDGVIKPLIYKIYNPEGDTSKIAKNKTYISQLENLFSNNSKVKDLLNGLEYNKVKLIKIFDLYNGNSKTKNTVKGKINISLRPGATLNNLNIVNSEVINAKFPSKTSFRIGIELEYIFPFNKNKWAIVFEPTYYDYSNDSPTLNSNSSYYSANFDGTAKYSRIELPLGFRHYMFLNNNSKIFINGLVNFTTFIQKSGQITYQFDSSGTVYSLDTNNNGVFFNFGAGYNYKNKYIAEIRFENKNILKNYNFWDGNFSCTSIIFGYNIF